MWVPESEREILEAVERGDLAETATFDAKASLPAQGRSKDLAVDVAAMASDGGTLLYGIAEDENGRPTRPNPIELAGAAERVDQIVRMCISEPPDIEVRSIPTEADPSVGYLVIVVPPSPRAPHMVTIREDNRYYGRSAKGNVRLTEGDVARLYERRQRWETDRKALLDEAIARAPITPDEGYAYLHLVARPVVPDENLLDRAMGSQHVANFLDGLFAAALEDEVWPRHEGGKHFEPDLTLDNRWFRRAEGWRTVQGLRPNFALFEEPGLVLDTEIGLNGTGWLFCGGAAERMQSGELWLFEDLVAGLTSRFLRVLGGLYAAGAYVGPVDAGLAVTGVEDAVSSHLGRHPVRKYRRQPYDRDVYRRTARFPAAALRDDPHGSARELVSFLTRAITAEQYDPFSD